MNRDESSVAETHMWDRKMANLEDVFRLSGFPTYTFVEPALFNAIKVAIRTPGRCVVLEGPSGIGKTSTVSMVLDQLDRRDEFLELSARRNNDIGIIANLP